MPRLQDFYQAREYLEMLACSDDTDEDEQSELANVWLLLNAYCEQLHGREL
jgi:hypothetical protein